MVGGALLRATMYELYRIPLILGPFLTILWLFDRAWCLVGKDLRGEDPYRLLRVPILVAAWVPLQTVVSMIRMPMTTGGVFRWLSLVWLLPLVCVVPRIGRQLKWVAALAGAPLVYMLVVDAWQDWWNDHSFLSSLFLICGPTLILRCVAAPAGADPRQGYRERLPAMIICAVCGLAIASLVFLPWDGGRSNRILWPDYLGLLALPGLIPALGKKTAVVIACTSLAMVPAVLWAVLLGMRVAGR